MSLPKALARIHANLRELALSLPETSEHFPWGHTAIKVRDKAFLFLADENDELSLSVKLPQSRDLAVDLDFAEPTGYGLGKSGWVTARFASGADVPLAMLRDWIRESYTAIAPKKLSRLLREK